MPQGDAPASSAEAINARIAEDAARRRARNDSLRERSRQERAAINSRIAEKRRASNVMEANKLPSNAVDQLPSNARNDQPPSNATDDQLPSGWEAAVTDDGRTYFWSPSSGEVTWTRPTMPADADAADDAPNFVATPDAPETPLPDAWEAVEADDGRTYYWNVDTDEITWSRPLPSAEAMGPVRSPAVADATRAGDTQAATTTPLTAHADSHAVAVGASMGAAASAAGEAPPARPPARVVAEESAAPAAASGAASRAAGAAEGEAGAAEGEGAEASGAEAVAERRCRELSRAGHRANELGDAAAAKRFFLDAAASAPAHSERAMRCRLSAANMCFKLDELHGTPTHALIGP